MSEKERIELINDCEQILEKKKEELRKFQNLPEDLLQKEAFNLVIPAFDSRIENDIVKLTKKIELLKSEN